MRDDNRELCSEGVTVVYARHIVIDFSGHIVGVNGSEHGHGGQRRYRKRAYSGDDPLTHVNPQLLPHLPVNKTPFNISCQARVSRVFTMYLTSHPAEQAILPASQKGIFLVCAGPNRAI